MNDQTEGQYRVGVDFNPSANPAVDQIKAKAAELIDLVGHHSKDDRCGELAANALEDGAMWAVKSVTKRPRA